jgi:hypothetical protein
MASARANFRRLLGGRGASESGAKDKKVYLEAPVGWPPQKNTQWCTASRTFPSPWLAMAIISGMVEAGAWHSMNAGGAAATDV